MKNPESIHILTAIIIFSIVTSFVFIIKAEYQTIPFTILFSALIILIAIFAKKFTAHLLDSNVEHEIWQMKNFGFTPEFQLKKSVPTGIILPLIITVFSLGTINFSAFLTYEARALKYRASKRFGFYSFAAMTDYHNAIIGASSILALLILSLITYLSPIQNLELLSKLSIYYAFWNLIPFSKLDGSQIFFGSRILWTTLATITTIATFLAITTI